MAKWIYERWGVKWDPSLGGGNTSYRTCVARVDIRTMEAIETSAFAEGDIAIPLKFMLNGYNAGESVIFYVRFHEATTDGRGLSSTTYGGTKDWLASQRIKDTRLSDIVLEEGTVPDDGIHTDGHWYVKLKPAFPTMRILRNGQWIEAESGFVLKDGVWKPIEDVFVLKDGQWKNVQ